MTESPTARLVLLQRTRVEQAIDRDRFGQFAKEVLRAESPSGRTLGLVRKLRDDVERRGAVLLVHGFAQNRYSWHLSTRSFVNFLADAGFDVWNLELTGHGRSREYGTGPARGFDEYIEDTAAVIRAVAAHVGGPIFVVGHSLGGAVLYATAPRVQECLRGVVGIAAIFAFGSNPMLRSLARLVTTAQRFTPLGALGRLGAGVRARAVGEAIANWWDHADLASAAFPLAGWVPGSTEPHVLQERVVRGFDWTGVAILTTMMRWAADGDFSGERGERYADAFCGLDVPLLVIAGDRDRLLPPEDARPAYDRSAARDKTWKLFSDQHEEVHWGHLDIVLGRDAPRFVWPYVLQWLSDRAEHGQPADTA